MKAEISIPSQPNCRLTNKVAIVTGAGRGIGRAIALTFAEEGADVIIVARTLSEIEQTADLIRSGGGSVLALPADVSDWKAVSAVVDRAQSEFGGIHILVNNAGVQGPIGPLFENDIDTWLRTIQINLVGTFLCCKAVLPAMIQQGFGKIINLSGGGATSPRPNFSAYAASKAAVVRLTENLAAEVRSHNIQVNAIAPGAVNTHMLDEILEAGAIVGESVLKEAERQKEEGGTSPDLAASLAVYLASDASDGLTGKLIAAPHDDWQSWDQGCIKDLMSEPWFTLRRIDPYTLRPLASFLAESSK